VVLDTDDIQELASPTNRWYTDTRSRAALSAGVGISYNSGTGVITNAVTSGLIATALGYTPADDALVVKLAGSQTITGTKTFQQAPLLDLGAGFKNSNGVYNYLQSLVTGWQIPVNGNNHNLIFSTTTNYVYTFPNATGTIALTSDLSAYVPYTGATGNVDLGIHTLIATQVKASSSAGLSLNSNNGTQVANLGAGGGANITFYGGLTGTTATFTNSGSGIGLGVTLSGSTGDGIKITHSAGRAFNIQSSGSGYGVLINNETASTSAPFTIQKQGSAVVTFTDAGILTLSGALNATAGNFSGDVTLTGGNPRLYLTDSDNNPDYFISNTDGTFTVYDVTNSVSRLTLSNLYTTLNNTLKVEGDILIKQDSVFGPIAGYTGIGSDAAGIFLRLGTASSHAYIVLSSLTNYRNFTLPDATGTFALTSDLSAYLPLSGGTLTGALSGTSATFSTSDLNTIFVSNPDTTGATTGSGLGFKAYNGTSVTQSAGIFLTSNTWSFGTYSTNQLSIGSDGSGGLALRSANSAPITFFTGGASAGVSTLRMQVNSNGTLQVGGTNEPGRISLFQSSTKTYSTSSGNDTDLFVVRVNSSQTNEQIASLQLVASGNSGTSAGRAIINVVQSVPSANTGHITFQTNDAGTIAERVRIQSNGSILVNRTSDTLSAYGWTLASGGGGNTVFAITNNEVFIYNNLTGGTNYKIDFRTISTSRGNINVTDTAVAYNTSSDYRLKQDLKSFNGLELINKIKTYDYEWKADKSRSYGTLAHELQEVLPYVVFGEKDGEQMQSVDYSKIVPVMVQAIKDLKAKIETLENK
jgi:hypothetical protein